MADPHSGPSEAMIQLIAPDGYYTYLNIPKPTAADIAAAAENYTSSFINKGKDDNKVGGVDEDMVKKHYRKLSLKHHPDKPGGDADTFRVLNRAQKVLMNPKLRQQYDILGLDLDDDDANNLQAGGGDDDGEEENQGIVHEIATMAMASIMHLGVRTAMMGLVSTIVVRYLITLIPALLFMVYIGYTIFSTSRLPDNHPNKTPAPMLLGPTMIAGGLLCMHYGRKWTEATEDTPADWQWTWLFWLGEAVVVGMFTYNSIGGNLPAGMPLYGGIAVFSILVSLWVRGRFWTYVSILVFELVLILFVVMAFPVMEMILETILNEKLRKVGDKVRAHQKTMEAYYEAKYSKN